MRIMITGGRSYGYLDPKKILEHPKRRAERKTFREALDALTLLPGGVTEIIHGDETKGVDRRAKEWATGNRIKETPFPAAWGDLETQPCVVKVGAGGARYNALAGFARNQRMVDSKPDLVVAFPGGKGTADAVARARAAGIEVMVIT
jgi:hypothetical protein